MPGGLGQPPNRYTRDYLRAYSQMPWLRAVAGKIGHAVASAEWKLYTKTTTPDPKHPNDKPKPVRDQRLQRSLVHKQRQKMFKALEATESLKAIETHPLLDVLNDANSFHTGLQVRKLTQIHIDLVGEAFWLKERDSMLGTVIGVWPIPPDWVLSTPTPTM